MITDLTEIEQDKEITQIADMIKSIETQATHINVTDATSNDLASSVSLVAKDVFDQLESKRKKAKEPILKAGKLLDKFFSELTDRADAVRKTLQNQMKMYFIKQENARIEQEEKNALKIEKAIEKGKPIPILTGVTTTPQVRTDAGLSTMKKEWTYEVLNVSAIPDAFVIREPNRMAIMGAIKGGVREIAGVRIFEDVKMIQRNG